MSSLDVKTSEYRNNWLQPCGEMTGGPNKCYFKNQRERDLKVHGKGVLKLLTGRRDTSQKHSHPLLADRKMVRYKMHFLKTKSNFTFLLFKLILKNVMK